MQINNLMKKETDILLLSWPIFGSQSVWFSSSYPALRFPEFASYLFRFQNCIGCASAVELQSHCRILALGLTECSFHFTSSLAIPRQSRLAEVSLYFKSRNLSQSWLTDALPSLYPRPAINRQMRLRNLSACPWGYVSFWGATWLLQQGIRIYRCPLSCLSSSPCLLVHSSTHRIIRTTVFPSLHPFMYNKHISTLDRATLMYATGRPSNVHFLAPRGSLSSGKLFVEKAFLTQKQGASAASNVAWGSCAYQTIHYP